MIESVAARRLLNEAEPSDAQIMNAEMEDEISGSALNEAEGAE